jgi:hypothetical protein
MEKKPDQWNEIANLINQDKKRALDDFHIHEFVPGGLPARQTVFLSGWRLRLRPVGLAAAAAMFLALGLVSFWLLHSSWQKTPAAVAQDSLLAGSFLYDRGSEPEEKVPEPRTVSIFSPALSAWAAAADLKPAAPPAAEAIGPAATVEHGDPAALYRKMKKVIRENSIERMLTQFCQICKEV